MIWRQLEDDVARFQHRKPLPRGGVGHAGIRTQRAEVYQLPNPPGAQPHEASEARKVAYLPQPPHVALDVGLHVVAERLPRVESLVENSGIEPGVDDVVYGVACANAPPLRQRERQEAEQRRPPCERLADGAGQPELLATREHEQAVAALFVCKHLEVG